MVQKVHIINWKTLVVLTLHDEAWAGLYKKPGPAEPVLARLLDELELDGDLPGVGNGQGAVRRLHKSDSVEHNVRCVHHNLETKLETNKNWKFS